MDGLIWFSRFVGADHINVPWTRSICADGSDFQNVSCVLDGCCRHTACPLLIAGRCDGPASSVTPRPWGRAYQVWSISVQFSSAQLQSLRRHCERLISMTVFPDSRSPAWLLRTCWRRCNWILPRIQRQFFPNLPCPDFIWTENMLLLNVKKCQYVFCTSAVFYILTYS